MKTSRAKLKANAKYAKSEKGKIAKAKARANYRKTEKGKITEAKYKQSEKGKTVIFNARAKFYGAHKIEISIHRKTEKSKMINIKYRQSEKGKIAVAKSQAKRKRNLGFHPISFPIIGVPFDWHHVSRRDVVAIPRDIHRAVSHVCGDGKLEGVIG